MQTFHELPTAISTYSAEWKEYFDVSQIAAQKISYMYVSNFTFSPPSPRSLISYPRTYWDQYQSIFMTVRLDKDCYYGKPSDQKRCISLALYMYITLEFGCHHIRLMFTCIQLARVCDDFVVMILGTGLSTAQSLSIDSLLPHTVPQIPILCMLPLSTPTTDGCSSSGTTTDHVALLETAANLMKRRLHSFSLLSRKHCDQFMVELTQLASEDCWVVIKHCHLYSNWRQVLQQIIQVHVYSV